MKSIPTRYKKVDDPTKLRRQVFCTHYGECLDYAIEKNWEGFSCEQCFSFEDERPDLDLLIEEESHWMRLVLSAGLAELRNALE